VQWQLPGDQSDAMVSGRASLGRSLDYDGPQPNMSIEEPLQSRNTSQWHFSSAGEMISPTISMESFIEPIQVARGSTDEGGITSAIGFPKRVTRMVFFVLSTCCSSERHFALNWEMLTSCIVHIISRAVSISPEARLTRAEGAFDTVSTPGLYCRSA
jgi:hypothetical protein